MKNIFSKTTEKRTQNGVKSYLSPTFVLSPILIFAFLTLGVGQVWAGAGLYEVYFEYSYSGTNSSATYTDKTSSIQTIDLGTLTADFKLTSIYPKVWKDNNGNICGCLVEYYISSDEEITGFSYDKSLGNNNHQWKRTDAFTVAQYNSGASGSYTFWYRFKAWGSSSSKENCGDNSYYIPTGGVKNKFTYSIAPPAVSGFGVSTSGHLAGSGTEEDPYLVKSGNSLTFTVSGSKARTDDNSTFNYWLNSGAKQTSGTLSTGSITSSDLQSAVVHAQCINNSSSSLVGTESTSTIYYKAVSVKDISVYIYVGGCTESQINSIELFGTPCVGSKALAAVRILAAGFTTDGNWRKYTFTNVSEVRNVVVAREGGRAVDNITITDDIYYKFDGTNLGGKCVPPSLTWTTAPADGKVGNNMTAAVNTTPVSGGSPSVTWSTSNSNIADVNESTGVISYKAAGSATITARVTWSATGDYCAGSSDLAQTITVSAPSQEPVLGAVTATPSGQQNYGELPIDFALSVTSTYLPNPVVVFLVNDGETTYEVVGAPYGANGNDAAGTIGPDPIYTTVHKATFTASAAKTYTVSAKLYEGLLLANWDGKDFTGGGGWEGSNGHDLVANPNKQAVNGSNYVRQFKKGGNYWEVDLYRFAGANQGIATFRYAHTRQYRTEVGKTWLKLNDGKGDIQKDDNLAANTWQKVVYDNGAGTPVDFFFPLLKEGNTSVYFDDIILSNEETMTVKASEAAPASFSINTVTLNNNGATTPGTESVIVTYGSALSNITVPSKTDYTFYGYYTENAGEGRQLINDAGEWIASVDGYTNENKKWVHDGDVTLYAYYKKAQITRITFSPGNIVAPGATVTVTATIEPAPAGETTICWRVLYSNDNPLDPQPTFTPAEAQGKSVSFIAPEASGSYKVEATLRKGTGCGGEEIHTFTAPFQVAGDHTVTVQYKCGNTTIKASTSATGKPLEWTAITAPEIVGYSFLKWVEGDGITIEGASEGEKTTATINFKAIYDGKLTAIYSKKNMIYFNNTLGWSDVYVYFYDNNKYWSDTYGSGAQQTQAFNGDHKPYWEQEHGKMTRIEGTNIWYFDYTAVGYTTRLNVVFTERDQHGNQWFHQTNVVRRGDHKSSLPMFVPLAGQTPVTRNTSAKYYNEGYWMNYPENTGYSLHIYKGTAKGERDEIRSIAFPFTADKTMPMEVTLELNANTIYGYEIHRADGAYYAYNGTIKINASSDIKLSADQRGGIKTSAAGDYVFKLNFGNSDGYGYLFSVQYPASEGSYRLVYKDLAEWSQGSAHTDAWSHPSRVIYKNEGAADTVSFFIAKGHTPTIQIQKIKSIDNEGNITWENVGSATSYDNVSAAGVYNFITSQTASALSIDKVEPYTGNYYIRTDNAGSTKWDNYRAADHQMTYSEFSKDRATNTFGELYTHYYMHWCPRGTNVKFCIANDYSSCITDTLENDLVDLHNMVKAGWLNSDGANPDYRDKFSANIRFMYDERTNKISRAYMSSSTNTDRKFLVLKSNTEFWNSDGSALNGSGESAVEGNYEAIFKDNEDWIYEREIKLNPGQKFKLYASYAQATVQENGSQHFCGNYADNNWENAENYVALVGGTGDACNVRIIYDFKTNRLLAAMVPSGEISTEMDIYADVMFIREHQGDIEQLIFNSNGKITNIKTAYAVMRFNKWTLNNKDKDTHNPLASPASIYERAMYFISFPFEVKLSEVFGFGTYGQDWIIEYYDGAERARTGWWEGQPGFWRYVWDRKNFVLKPNVGYLLELELGNFKEGSGFWNNNNERLELFFPSSGNLGSITNTTVNCTIPEHTCYINRHETEGLPDTPENPRTSYNRTIFDSHWNVMSVPTYVNATPNEWSNTIWTTKIGPKFLYTWNMEDNTLTATSAVDYRYHAMHAYMVQYGGNVQWVTSGTKPAAIVARNTYAEEPKEVEFRLEIQQNEKMVDQTFVIMSNDDQINANFQFGEDMSKDFNARNANIYTMTADNVAAAGNSLPMSENTTIVPVGVSVKKTGDYTFSIPDGTNGVGITLIDEETGIRTSLSALDYTVNLAAGDYTERFWLEISPIQNTPTGIEEPTSDSSLKGRAQKRIIDGVLYIVKDGKIFDARGTRVE